MKQSILIPRRSAMLMFGVAASRLGAQTISIEKLDLFPAFFRSWEETKNASREMRAQRFLELVVNPHVDLFDGFAGGVSLERATQYLDQVEPLVPDIETLHGWIGSNFDRNLADFKNALPDFIWSGSVVFMPTLFGFDSGGGQLNGKSFLIFGLDAIAKLHGPRAALSVLFSHELFHLYHAGFHQPKPGEMRGNSIPLYRLVWTEGLASYASQQLNPKADLAAIFLSTTLAASCQDRLKPLAAALLKDLDSTEKGPFMEWMSAQKRTSDVPPRAGYYFGWRAAQALGRQRTLPELARFADDEVRSSMLTELQALARN
jgi:hypothetical protein